MFIKHNQWHLGMGDRGQLPPKILAFQKIFFLLENFLRKSISKKGREFSPSCSENLVGLSRAQLYLSPLWNAISLCRQMYCKFQVIFQHVQCENSKWKSLALFNTNLCRWQFAAVCRKIAASCFPQLFNPRCCWSLSTLICSTWPMSSQHYTGYVSRNGELQTSADGISCSVWHGTGVFESAHSGIRPARLSSSSVVIYTKAVCSVWQPLAVTHFLLQLQLSRTLCLSTSSHHHLFATFRQRLKTFLFQQSFPDSGINPARFLGSGPQQLFRLPGSIYWWTQTVHKIKHNAARKLEIVTSRGT